jgi:hypothetical protein
LWPIVLTIMRDSLGGVQWAKTCLQIDRPIAQQNQSGKSAGVAGQHLPEVRIHDHAESGQATGF